MKIINSATVFNIIVMTSFFLITSMGSGIAAEKKKRSKRAYQQGEVHRISTREVVIDDCLYRYAKNTLFLSNKGGEITPAWFYKGETVKFAINSEDRIVIIKKHR